MVPRSNCRGVIATHAVGAPMRSGTMARASAAMGALSSVSVAQHAALVCASSSGSQMRCAPENSRPGRSWREVVDADGVTARAHREGLRYGRRGDDGAVQAETERRAREVRPGVLRRTDLDLAEARVPGQRKAEAPRAENRVVPVERAPVDGRVGGNGEQCGDGHVRVRLFPTSEGAARGHTSRRSGE